MSSEMRVQPGRFPQIGLLATVLAHAGGRQAGSAPLNLFLVLGRHRRLFRGWLHFAGRLMPGGVLPRADSELVILRVAHLRGSVYEQNQHVRIGRRAGLDDGDIERVTTDEVAGWSPRQRAMLAVVDELLDQRDVGDAAWQDLRQHLDEREAIELVLLAGHYDMLAAAIATLRIQPERVRR
ncbi:MAG: carboxymuconolactone decarboxylase family protein [Actinomycetota bacterium]|nr:carboxymuconolactone decarboxylase family protein [Actinomycetota bacterium]